MELTKWTDDGVWPRIGPRDKHLNFTPRKQGPKALLNGQQSVLGKVSLVPKASLLGALLSPATDCSPLQQIAAHWTAPTNCPSLRYDNTLLIERSLLPCLSLRAKLSPEIDKHNDAQPNDAQHKWTPCKWDAHRLPPWPMGCQRRRPPARPPKYKPASRATRHAKSWSWRANCRQQ